MKTRNNLHFRWDKKKAMELESIVYKDPQSVPVEHILLVEKFNIIWTEMAETIQFDSTDHSVAVADSIAVFFKSQDRNSVFSRFDDPEEAAAFFNDFRTVRAQRALHLLINSPNQYSPAVQSLIAFLGELVENSSIAFRDDPPLRLEKVLNCIEMAILINDISYDILRLLHQIIHELEVYLFGYSKVLDKEHKGSKRSAGKQEAVERRLKTFEEFDAYFEQKKSENPKISKMHAARSYYKNRSVKDEYFAACWKNEKTFYNSLCHRNQSPVKNKVREEKKQKDKMPYELSPWEVEIMNEWLSEGA